MTIKEFKDNEIRRMLKEGRTTQEIGRALGITRQAIWLWLKENGYTTERKWIEKKP